MAGQVRTAKVKYHITNPTTGEIETIETKVDIGLLEDYNGWVIENKLNPPTYSPQEYAKHLELQSKIIAIDKALEFIEGCDYDSPALNALVRILNNEE